MKKYFWEMVLTIKYWLQGQEWIEAHQYAKTIVRGFK